MNTDDRVFIGGVIVMVMTALLAVGIMKMVYGQEGLTFTEPEVKPDLTCLKFSDGRFAVVVLDCYNSNPYPLISWLLSKKYHIDAIAAVDNNYDRMYLSR